MLCLEFVHFSAIILQTGRLDGIVSNESFHFSKRGSVR